jgi:hypothetical protein
MKDTMTTTRTADIHESTLRVICTECERSGQSQTFALRSSKMPVASHTALSSPRGHSRTIVEGD